MIQNILSYLILLNSIFEIAIRRMDSIYFLLIDLNIRLLDTQIENVNYVDSSVLQIIGLPPGFEY